MRIFITGATGYIGEQLALRLAALHYEVVALIRSPEKTGALAAAGVHFVEGNLSEEAALNEGMVGCDAVFHLAAYARPWPEDAQLFYKINVEGTRQVLEAAQRNNIKKVIVTSSASVYGPSPQPGVAVDEETPKTYPYFSYYEISKAEADKLSREFAANGLHVVLLHPARVYGPGRESGSNAILKMIDLYQKGIWRFLPGDGKGIGSYCYIADVVDAYLQALEHGRSGESYLLGGHNVSYEEFFTILQRLTGKQRKLYRVPLFVLLQLSKLLTAFARVTGTSPLITPSWTKKYMHDNIISSRKAMKELHYNITPLATGLKLTLDYIKNEH